MVFANTSGFQEGDLVQFIGRDARRIFGIRTDEGTTGVVRWTQLSDPYVEVEIDKEEGSGKGGGSAHRLATFNWHITGVPIRLTRAGLWRRHILRVRVTRDEQLARASEHRNPSLLALMDKRLAENAHIT